MVESPYLTVRQLAERWQMNPGSLHNMRAAGRGPVATRIGTKVLYGIADVEAYEAANRGAAA